MIELSLSEGKTYDRLYHNRPKTTQGRIRRAILLIRKGWCNSRAYDDCFEIGDGQQVLEGLLDYICRKEPKLRDELIRMGYWGREYDEVMNRQGNLFSMTK